METYFDKEFFAGNRLRLRELFTGTAPIVITANGQLQKSADEAYPFVQDKNFWYLTGCDVADALLVIDKDKEYIILPARSNVQDIFDGSIAPETIQNISGVSAVYDAKEGFRQLNNRLKKVKHVATVAAPPAYIEVYGMHTNPARARLVAHIKEQNPDVELLDVRDHLARLRSVKQAPELDAIKKAIAVTGKGLKLVTRQSSLAKYTYEYDVEADLTRAFTKEQSEHAFEPIIAAGKRATIIHSPDKCGALSKNDLLLFDVGARMHGYAADISRTIAIGEPTKRQQAIYTAVAEVQDYAFGLLRPGITIHEYEQQVVLFMGEKLRELNLIKTIENEEVRKFFPHATSHFLGLDTHDLGDYDRPLEPGMVLTVEPGIYVADEAIGVRLEDDVLITDNGAENLSADLPRTL